MARVSDYSDRRDTLRGEHVEGRPRHLVGTVMSAQLYRQNTLCGIEFYEWPGYVVWARGKELRYVVDHHGPETDDWSHRSVVLELVNRNNPRTGSPIEKYVVAPADEWVSMAEQARQARAHDMGEPDPEPESPRRRLRPRAARDPGQDNPGTR